MLCVDGTVAGPCSGSSPMDWSVGVKTSTTTFADAAASSLETSFLNPHCLTHLDIVGENLWLVSSASLVSCP